MPRPSPRQGGASAGRQSQLSLSFPSSQEGQTSPSYIPAGSDLASAVARERGRRKQERDCRGRSSRWKSQGQLCIAQREPGIQGGRSIRPRKMSRGHSKASGAGEVGCKGGGGAAQMAGSSFFVQGPQDPFLGRSPGLPNARRKGPHWGYQRGGLVGRGWAQSP